MVLDYPLSYNMALKSYFKKEFNNHGFLDYKKMTEYSDHLIQKFDVRSGQGSKTIARSMSVVTSKRQLLQEK